jgi:chitin disaccharide deacetylase
MLIINADDLGRSRAETDAALRCLAGGRITSATMMVLMDDSERAAELANEAGLDTGLHLNFDQPFTGSRVPAQLRQHHNRTVSYLRSHKLAQLVYYPSLRGAFAYSYQQQRDEFCRLFCKAPSHVDGHHHMHLCANVAFGNIIPRGTKLRRTFSFSAGEKGLVNRAYRRLLDSLLRRRYKMPDYFFDLRQSLRGGTIDRVIALAGDSVVELMTHPVDNRESDYLLGREFGNKLARVQLGTYASLGLASCKAHAAAIAV